MRWVNTPFVASNDSTRRLQGKASRAAQPIAKPLARKAFCIDLAATTTILRLRLVRCRMANKERWTDAL
jgi:hypothetical protein